MTTRDCRAWGTSGFRFTSLCLAVLFLAGCRQSGSQVVAYCAQDQVYAEPLFREFERQSGIRVLALYDSEAVKTVGLANRLLAEREHPGCDVFWGNEEMRTRQLAGRELFRETDGWSAVGFRSRRIVLNTNRISVSSGPRSLLELTNSQWRGKVALAYPQFGTTATHFHALRQLWGAKLWQEWVRALAANQPFLAEGNSSVVKLVGRGDVWLGLTDSDDVLVGQREGLPIAALPPGPETLFIPNTVAVIRDGPNPGSAQRLFEFLASAHVAENLVANGALEGAVWGQVPSPRLQVEWDKLLADLESTTAELKQVFLR